MFGEHLILRRRIEAKVGESRFTIHDEVENIGWDPTPHMLLYHINVGFPVVDEGAELLVPTRAITPRGDYPAEGYRTLDAPEPSHVERVFEHDSIPEPGGTVPVGIVNRARGIGAYEVFNLNQLPFHFVWRMLGEGTYVVGIEPCTNRTAGRLDARERGELIILQPGDAAVYDLELGALVGPDEIDGFVQRVAALAASSGPGKGRPAMRRDEIGRIAAAGQRRSRRRLLRTGAAASGMAALGLIPSTVRPGRFRPRRYDDQHPRSAMAPGSERAGTGRGVVQAIRHCRHLRRRQLRHARAAGQAPGRERERRLRHLRL